MILTLNGTYAIAQSKWELQSVIAYLVYTKCGTLYFIICKQNRAFKFDLNDEHPKNVKPWPSSVHPPEEPWPVVLRRAGYNLVRGQHINPSNTLI